MGQSASYLPPSMAQLWAERVFFLTDFEHARILSAWSAKLEEQGGGAARRRRTGSGSAPRWRAEGVASSSSAMAASSSQAPHSSAAQHEQDVSFLEQLSTLVRHPSVRELQHPIAVDEALPSSLATSLVVTASNGGHSSTQPFSRPGTAHSPSPGEAWGAPRGLSE